MSAYVGKCFTDNQPISKLGIANFIWVVKSKFVGAKVELGNVRLLSVCK